MKHSAPSLPRRRAVRLGLVLTPVLAVAVGTSVIWQTSYAAFSATTANGSNTWNSGGVAISDDDGGTTGSVLFDASGLKPGSTGTRCITVTASGSLPAAIRLYGTGYSASNSLPSYLSLVVTQGTGGSYGSCTGFTADATSSEVFNGKLAAWSTVTDYGSGRSTWSTAGGATESKTFMFRYTLDSTAPTTGTQNGTASLTFTWETQNT